MTLREQVLRGGAFLVLRQGLGLGINAVGLLLLTRWIGPTNYGLYAGALGIFFFLLPIVRMGADVYLIRREGVVDEVVYHQAFSFLLLSGIGLSGLSLLVSPLVVYWVEDPRFLAPLQALLLLLPLATLEVPAVAHLERALDYQKIAGIELMGLLLQFALALPLAWLGFGVWAPIAGFSLSQAWRVGASYALARYRPRLSWSPELLRDMLGYGSGYVSSTWIWHLRRLVNPLIVGRYLGPEGVGYVALAIRFVEALGFVKETTWRIAVAALAKVQQDLARLRRAMEEAMGLQALALGPVLAGFALVAPWLVPHLFGDEWSPVLLVYPFVALRFLLGAVFQMHASVLYVLRRNWVVAAFNLVYIVLFVGAALLLVPRLGVIGYGWAELITVVGFPIFHLSLARIFSFSYGRAQPWLLAFMPPLFFPLTGSAWGLLLWAFPLLLIFSNSAHTQVREYWTYLTKEVEPVMRILKSLGKRST